MIQAPLTQYIPVQQPMPAVYPQQGANTPIQYPQAPNYFYNYPSTSFYPQTQSGRSQFNGVNIEINNPQGQGGLPINGNFVPAMPYYNQPVQQIPMQPMPAQPLPAQPMPAQQIPAQPLPVQPMPAQQIPVQPMPAQPMPAQQIPAQPMPQGQEVLPAAPVIDTPAAPTSSISPESFTGRLKSNDLDEQFRAIEDMVKIIKNDNEGAKVLLETSIVDALVDIVNKDTSNLQGPSDEVKELRSRNRDELTEDEKIKADTESPLEKAENNKSYALFTLSYIQTKLNEVINKTIPIDELPAISTVISAVKENPNPTVRLSGISALAHLARPEYKEVLQTIFELAQADEDESVRTAASEELKNLNNI